MQSFGNKIPGFVSPWRQALDTSARERDDDLIVDDSGNAFHANQMTPGAVSLAAENLIANRDKEYDQRVWEDNARAGKCSRSIIGR